MIDYLNTLLPNLKQFSDSLDKKALLIEQPWVSVNGEGSFQKFIFRKNKELIVSNSGKVITGNWEYLPSAKSLMIEWGENKILLNQQFVDKGVLVLKYDGLPDKLFFLANENVIPDLNIKQYLQNIFYKKWNVVVVKGTDNRAYEFLKSDSRAFTGLIGQKVLLDAQRIDDCDFQEKGSNYKYYVRDSKVYARSSFFEIKVGEVRLMVESFFGVSPNNRAKKGDLVRIDGDFAPDGVYQIGIFRKLRVKNGVIV